MAESKLYRLRKSVTLNIDPTGETKYSSLLCQYMYICTLSYESESPQH